MRDLEESIKTTIQDAVAKEVAKLLENARQQGIAEGSARAVTDETDYSIDTLLKNIRNARFRLAQLAENDNLMPKPTKDERRKSRQANQKARARRAEAKLKARAELIRLAFRGEVVPRNRGDIMAIQHAIVEARGVLERKSRELEQEARRQEPLLKRLAEIKARTNEIVQDHASEEVKRLFL